MTSPQTHGACGEHKLSFEEEKTENNSLNLLNRAQWLRAAILGANDGLLSTTSLMLGIGAAKEDQKSMILSGLAGALAGACSMAVGEFVSVSTQRDIEKKMKNVSHSNSKASEGDDVRLDIDTYANQTPINLIVSPIFVKKVNDSDQSFEKVSPMKIIEKNSPFTPKSPLMKVIAGDTKKETVLEPFPNPFKAAFASALSFLFGSLFPLIPAMLVADDTSRVIVIIVVASIALALFGGIGAYLGGSCIRVSAVRVLLGGWVSMALTYGLLKPLDNDDKKGHDSD